VIDMAHPCDDPGSTPDQLFGLKRSEKRVALTLSVGLEDRRMNELPPTYSISSHDTRMTSEQQIPSVTR
jgi:hypothetical protein